MLKLASVKCNDRLPKSGDLVLRLVDFDHPLTTALSAVAIVFRFELQKDVTGI
jgi:hypothetical protein